MLCVTVKLFLPVLSGANVQGSVKDAGAAVQLATDNVFGLPAFALRRLGIAKMAAAATTGDLKVIHRLHDAHDGTLAVSCQESPQVSYAALTKTIATPRAGTNSARPSHPACTALTVGMCMTRGSEPLT